MNPEICLRPITVEAAPFLHALANDAVVTEALCEGPTDLGMWKDAIEVWGTDPDEADFLIVPTQVGCPVGWIGINGLNSVDRVAWIKMLALAPSAWGRGYASAAVGRRLAGNGYRRLKLWTDTGNARARACYERNGFVVESARRADVGSRRVLRDRLCMVCDL